MQRDFRGIGSGGGRNCGKSKVHQKPGFLCGVCWKTRHLLGIIYKKEVSRDLGGVPFVKMMENKFRIDDNDLKYFICFIFRFEL